MPLIKDQYFSSDDLKVISANPLEPSISSLRPLLNDANDDTAEGHRVVISKLVFSLAGHPVAEGLRTKTSNAPVDGELGGIFRLRSNDLNVTPFSPLTSLIVDKAQDTEIWKAVTDLITTLSRTTPDRNIAPSYSGTPILRSSGSFYGRQTRDELRPPLIEELDKCTFEDVPEFYTKYFENRSWTEQATEIYNRFKADDGLQSFPEKWDEASVWNWWNNFQEKYIQPLEKTTGIYYRTKAKERWKVPKASVSLTSFLSTVTRPWWASTTP